MRGRQHDPGGDRGSLALFVVVFSLGVLFLAALLVDLGSAMSAKERAADAAEQAARAAADDLNVTGLRNGNVTINTATACDNARQLVAQYARENGIDITLASQQPCSFSPTRPKVTVTVVVTTRPTILATLGTFTMTVQESACAETQAKEIC